MFLLGSLLAHATNRSPSAWPSLRCIANHCWVSGIPNVDVRVYCAIFSSSNSFIKVTNNGNSQGFPVPTVANPPIPNDVNWSKPPATQSMAYLRIRCSFTTSFSFSSCRLKFSLLARVEGWIKSFSIFPDVWLESNLLDRHHWSLRRLRPQSCHHLRNFHQFP